MGVSDLPIEARVCEQHGLYESLQTKFGASPCPVCMEEQARAQLDAERAERDAESRRRRADALFGRAAIPERFRNRTLENYASNNPGAANALKVAKGYADAFDAVLEDGSSLIFCGGVGTGKTHLAVGIARRVIEMDRIAVFTSVIGAVRSVKETYRKGSEITEAEAIGKLIEPDLLILDEVGVQFGSDTEKMILFEIINGRYEAVRPTILISNLALKPLEDFIGERTLDRLREGGGQMVVFDWPSYRRQA